MAQGKLKIKSKLPKDLQDKKRQRKGNAVTKRTNCPVKQKKKQHEETQKLKQIVSKTLNKAVEEETRARAFKGQKALSKAQQAVVSHHSKAEPS